VTGDYVAGEEQGDAEQGRVARCEGSD